jgi:thioredoxin-like negative regulator of GroEL
VRGSDEDRAPKQWGSLARKGTRQLKEEGAGPASQAWREAVERARGPEGADHAPPPWQPEVWVRDDPEPRPARRDAKTPSTPARRVGRAAAAGRPQGPRGQSGTPTRGGGTDQARSRRQTGRAVPTEERRPRRKPKELPALVSSELASGVQSSKLRRIQDRLTDAAGAYERDRYRDAARMLKPLAEQAPGVAAVRELYGLTLYRLGRWDSAIKEFEAFRAISGSYDQHPALADSYRAKKRWRAVDELWEELRRASPSPELVAEGRIVTAGSLADRGRTADAIALLEAVRAEVKRPKSHHLRTWYALADLYERAGEVPRARELFRRVLAHDADLYDTAERLAAIG